MMTEEERKAKIAARDKAYREANKEHVLARQKAYREANKESIKAKSKAWRDANPDRADSGNKAYRESARGIAKKKAYREANKDRAKAKAKVWKEANKDKRKAMDRVRRLRQQYALTPDQFNRMLSQCNGKCPCCKTPFSIILGGSPHVDHDHRTGRVRGILCDRCNLTIGHALDNPAILRDCARYLQRHAKIDKHATLLGGQHV